jgi:uncharacterized coiled-coil protein SlyX
MSTSLPDPETVDWEGVFDEMDHAPGEPMKRMGLNFAISMAVDEIETESDAAPLRDAAVEAGCLDKVNARYVVAGHEPDTDDSSDNTDSSSDDEMEGDPSTSNADDQADTDTSGDRPMPASMDRDDLEAEVAKLRKEVDKLQEVANRDFALLKAAVRNLVGQQDVNTIEDLPDAAAEHRDRLEQQANRVDDVASRLDLVDDLQGNGSQRKKIARLRQYCVQKANQENGGGCVDYQEAKGIFDDSPISDGYASNLIQDAAEHRWFYTKKPGDRTELRVDLEKVPPGHVFGKENSGGTE